MKSLKSVRFATVVVAAAAGFLIAGAFASHASADGGKKKTDDVFLDEGGDGDFNSASTRKTASDDAVPAHDETQQHAAQVSDEGSLYKVPTNDEPVAAEAPADKAPAPQAAEPVPQDVKDAVQMAEPATGGDTAQAPVAAPAPEKAEAAADEPAPKPAKKHVAHAAPVAKTKKAAAGKFVVTKDECPAMRSPASEGEPLFKTGAARKIWVEKVDDNWVRGFNKAGQAGYISTDCVK